MDRTETPISVSVQQSFLYRSNKESPDFGTGMEPSFLDETNLSQ
ncbi:hypothetical protein ACHYZU_002875 [Listeria monocytogenes]